MKLPTAIASVIAGIGVLLAAPGWITLVLASLAGDAERIAEISAGMIESAVYATIAASFGLGSLGAVGALIVKALAAE